MTAPLGTLTMPKLDGIEIKPGVWIIGEPTPVPGTDKLHALAEIEGTLCLVELVLKFPVDVKPIPL